ncbi:conserved hypothetical protein [Pseudomonas sp. IT-196MI5]
MWRGGLSDRRIAPFGCVAVVELVNSASLTKRFLQEQGCFAIQRGQAPSPQGFRRLKNRCLAN